MEKTLASGSTYLYPDGNSAKLVVMIRKRVRSPPVGLHPSHVHDLAEQRRGVHDQGQFCARDTDILSSIGQPL